MPVRCTRATIQVATTRRYWPLHEPMGSLPNTRSDMSVCRIGDEIAGVPVSRGINRWWTVLAGALACGVGAGIAVLYGFPILAASLERELGWDRSFYSFCLTCFLAATGVGTITLGVFIRRLGVRRAASL